MYKGSATLLAVCLAAAACDTGSTHDLTSPSLTREAASLSGAGRKLIRADGSTVTSTGSASSSLKLLAAAPAAGTTAQCDQGALVQDDEDPSIFRPEGGLPSGTYDNVEVPANAICVLEGVTVINGIRALSGSMLFIYSSSIGTNVQGLAAKVVQLNSETTVGGDLDVRNAGGGIYASCSVDNSTIQGDASCTANDPGSPIIRAEAGPVIIGGKVNLENNVIPAGNVLLLQGANITVSADVNKNAGAGFKSVNGNTVPKLDCKKNDPTFVGGPNTAGKAKGQCL